MRRLGLLAVLALVVAAGLVASGVIHIRVDVRPPSGAEAKPFWREKTGTTGLPEALGIWVEVARAVRPAVVNISTTEKVRSPLGDDVLRRFFQGPTSRPRTALGSGFIVSPDGYIVTNFHVATGRAARRRDHGVPG
jgi:S1-C subfamily serine protease